MAREQHDYDDIPGTFVFDQERSREGYGINMFCMSLMKDENRKAFKANEAEYLKTFNLTPEQTDAVLKRDYNRMLELGGNIYFTAKLGATDGHSFRHLAAVMTGASQEDYANMMLAGGRSVEGNRSRSGKVAKPVKMAKKATSAQLKTAFTGHLKETEGHVKRLEEMLRDLLDLSLDDAIQRGLRQNLGLILQSSAQKNANGQRLEELQALLPTVNADASIEVQQINLAAYGLKFPGFNPIIGPFQVIDFRAYLTQNLVNVSALKNYIAAKHNFAGAKLTAEDARDLVVLTVGNAYLLCIADAARIEAVNAELLGWLADAEPER